MKETSADAAASAPGARSTIRVLDVIELLARNPDLRLAEIAAITGHASATVHRVLTVLTARRWVVRDPRSDRYRLGLVVGRLARTASADDLFLQSAREVGSRLAGDTGETVHVAEWRDGQLRYALKWESTKALRVAMNSGIGSAVPLHATSLGKAVVAAYPSPQRVELIASLALDRYTDATIVDPSQLREECAEIGVEGFAVDNEENEPGVRCIGAAIVGPNGEPIGAISISAPATRLQSSDILHWGRRVRAAAEEITAAVGPSFSPG